MAKRETIIEIRIDNQDALNRLGKQQAELLKVRESIKLLNSIIRENGEANNNQARQLGELNVKQEALRKSTSTLAKDLAAVGVASKQTAEAAKASALETLKQTGALDKLDASIAKDVNQLGRWKAEQILVGKAQADLRKEIQANGAATEQQEKDLGDLATKAKFLSSNLNELTNDTAGLTAAGTRFRDKMASATLEALKQSGVIGQLDARTVALTADIDKLNAQFEAGTVDTAQYTANLDKLTKELDQTKAATAASEARFNALEAEFRQGKISADQFRASVDLLNKEVKTQGGLLQSGVNDLKSYVLGTIGVVAALQVGAEVVLADEVPQVHLTVQRTFDRVKPGEDMLLMICDWGWHEEHECAGSGVTFNPPNRYLILHPCVAGKSERLCGKWSVGDDDGRCCGDSDKLHVRGTLLALFLRTVDR